MCSIQFTLSWVSSSKWVLFNSKHSLTVTFDLNFYKVFSFLTATLKAEKSEPLCLWTVIWSRLFKVWKKAGSLLVKVCYAIFQLCVCNLTIYRVVMISSWYVIVHLIRTSISLSLMTVVIDDFGMYHLVRFLVSLYSDNYFLSSQEVHVKQLIKAL